MPLPILSFDELVTSQVTAMQAAAGVPIDFTVGAVFRALVESNAGNGLWLQSTAQALSDVTRASTSQGNDLDTWMAQFNFFRLLAIAASGFVTFSRFTANLQGTISVNALVFNVTTGVSYAVGIDATNPYFNASLNAYIVPAGISSTSVPVTATTAGTIGNSLANQITTIQSVVINFDSVTNAAAFVNGTDQETDAAFRVRFILYINSLSKATFQSIEEAVVSVKGVARYIIVENKDILDNPMPGFFYVVIDDGTGNASSILIGQVSAAVTATRGLTILFAVYAPIQFPIDITAHVFTDDSMPDATVQSAVIASLQAYVSSQGFVSLFPYSELPRIIYDTNLKLSGMPFTPIINVNNYSLNAGTVDIQLAGRQIPVNGTMSVIINA